METFVGKASMLTTIATGEFPSNYMPNRHEFTFEVTCDGESYDLTLWNTASGVSVIVYLPIVNRPIACIMTVLD